MRLPRETSIASVGRASHAMSVARAYCALLGALTVVVLMVSSTGTAEARDARDYAAYVLNSQAATAADPMAVFVRSSYVRPAAQSGDRAPGQVCVPAFMVDLPRDDLPKLECKHDVRPLAALRDLRALGSTVPLARIMLAQWVQVAGPEVSVAPSEATIPAWVSMADFVVPDTLPTISGQVRAGFYSLF